MKYHAIPYLGRLKPQLGQKGFILDACGESGAQKCPIPGQSRQKGPVLDIKGPLGDLGDPRRALGDQVWSELS